MLGNLPIRFLLFVGRFLKCIHYSVNTSEKVSITFWAFPRESPKQSRYCSNCLGELLDAFPTMSWHNFEHFLYISHKAACFCVLHQKSKMHQKNLKTIRGSPSYTPPDHTTYSQTQTLRQSLWATYLLLPILFFVKRLELTLVGCCYPLSTI